jgi:hypothetical protein
MGWMRLSFLNWFGGRLCGVSGLLSCGIKGDGYGSDSCRGTEMWDVIDFLLHPCLY